MNCHDIKTEIAKTRSIQQEIENRSSLTAKRCWDFWEISVSVTGLPKMMPRAKATVRLSQLTALQEKTAAEIKKYRNQCGIFT